MTTPSPLAQTTATLPPSDGKDNSGEAIYQQLVNADREKQIIAWAEEQFSRCRNARTKTEQQWYVNLAFYFGRQNLTLLRSGSGQYKLDTPKAPPWRVRLVVNRVRGYVRTELAKITSQRPRFTVVPATSEDEDLIAARVAEQIFDTVYTEKKIREVIKRAGFWVATTGTGYIKCYWDPTAKVKMPTPAPGLAPGVQGQGNVVPLQQEVRGDFCIEHVTPFHIYVPDLEQVDLEKQAYVIHATNKSVEWARQTFPKLKGVDLKGMSSQAEIMDQAFLGTIGSSERVADQVRILEFWIKPQQTAMFPNGAVLTLVNDQLVQVKEKYPYMHDEYPFIKFDNVPTGKFYSTCSLEDLIALQREYNRTRSQIIENKNLSSRPKLMAPKGSINPNQVTSEPGQVILYMPGFNPPTPLPMPPLPQYVLQEIYQLQQDMDDLAGQHEISRGQNPSQVTAATALSFLKEQDDTKLSATIESIENGVEKLGKQVLSLVTQFWTTPRLVRVVGKDQEFDAQLYQASTIRGNTDVRVESGSALPQSKAAKQAFVMDLMKMGFVPPEKGLEMMDLGGIERVYEDYLVDVRQAQRENQKMMEGVALKEVPPPQPQVDPMTGQPVTDPMTGQPVMPQADPLDAFTCNDYDNHAVHIDVHNKFRKGQQYENLPVEIKQVFERHVMTHQVALQTGMLPGGPVPGMGGGMGMGDPAAGGGVPGADPKFTGGPDNGASLGNPGMGGGSGLNLPQAPQGPSGMGG